MIILKTPGELDAMRRAGLVVAEALRAARAVLCAGICTAEIDAAVAGVFLNRGATPLLLGAPGPVPFPATACVSVNNEVAHGFPGTRRLESGDVVSIDTACRLDGWCADAAWTWIVGEGSAETRTLVQTGRDALDTAIAACVVGRLWTDVAKLIAACVRERGCALVAGAVGHGVGREPHEDPQVPNTVGRRSRQSGFRLEPGLVLAIEPTLTTGCGRVRRAANRWTLETSDGQPAAHFEHTVAITPEGPLVLTAGIHD